MSRVAPSAVELDADELYLVEAILAQPRGTVGNRIHWDAENRRTAFVSCITLLMRAGVVHFNKALCRMTLTGYGYRVLKANRERIAAEEAARPVMLPVPRHLVDDLAAAIRMGCWVWSPERERPMLEIREALLAAAVQK